MSLSDYNASDGSKSRTAAFSNKWLSMTWAKGTTPALVNAALNVPKGANYEAYNMKLSSGGTELSLSRLSLTQLNNAPNHSSNTILKLSNSNLSAYTQTVTPEKGSYQSYGAQFKNTMADIGYNHYQASNDFHNSAYGALDTLWANYLIGKSQDTFHANYKNASTQVESLATRVDNESVSKIDVKESVGNTHVEAKFAEYKKDQQVVDYSDVRADTKIDKNQYSVEASKSMDQVVIENSNDFTVTKNVSIKTRATNINTDAGQNVYMGLGLGVKLQNITMSFSQINQYANTEITKKYGDGSVSISHYENAGAPSDHTAFFNGITSNVTTFNVFNHYMDEYNLLTFSRANKFTVEQKIAGNMATLNWFDAYSVQHRQRLDLGYRLFNINTFYFKEKVDHADSMGMGLSYAVKTSRGLTLSMSLANAWGGSKEGWLGNITASMIF